MRRFPSAAKLTGFFLSFAEDEDEDEGVSPFDDEDNEFQDVDDAIYNFPDHDAVGIDGDNSMYFASNLSHCSCRTIST